MCLDAVVSVNIEPRFTGLKFDMSSQALCLPGKQKSRNHLSLQKKVKVIKTSQNNPSMNIRTLGEIFKCGKTQVARILKDKEALLTQYNSNASAGK